MLEHWLKDMDVKKLNDVNPNSLTIIVKKTNAGTPPSRTALHVYYTLPRMRNT